MTILRIFSTNEMDFDLIPKDLCALEVKKARQELQYMIDKAHPKRLSAPKTVSGMFNKQGADKVPPVTEQQAALFHHQKWKQSTPNSIRSEPHPWLGHVMTQNVQTQLSAFELFSCFTGRRSSTFARVLSETKVDLYCSHDIAFVFWGKKNVQSVLYPG